MSAESESLLVIGGFFAVVAVVLSLLLIAVRRASLRFDQWLLGRIPLRLSGIEFYCWYGLVVALGFTVLAILSEAHLFGSAFLLVVGGALLLAVGSAFAWHRNSLRKRGIVLLKRKGESDAAP